ncbi:MAG TPA: EamA/RhaT family transporter [Chromatiales bacterium]|nr:EamA/RhaT family transporter [Chromatiales bacterium]
MPPVCAVRIKPLHWAALLGLVALWGSSYLAIEIALRAWRPAEIAGLRIAAAAIVLLTAAVVGRRRFPLTVRAWGGYLAVAVIGNCIPFFLISWGQQGLESGLTGILAASTPLFTLVLAHWVLDDERMRTGQAVACVIGFIGVVVLLGTDSLAAMGGSGTRLLSQLAVLGGALCYAAATVGARFMPLAHPVVTAAAVMGLAAVVMAPASLSGAVLLSVASPVELLAIGFLGLFGTGLASIWYFYLIAETGARFTSLLNYLVPVWAVGLGRIVLGESIPLAAWLALALILTGLFLMRHSAPPARQAPPQERS